MPLRVVVWKGVVWPFVICPVTFWNSRARICEIRSTYISKDHVNCDLFSPESFISDCSCVIAWKGNMDLSNANLIRFSWFFFFTVVSVYNCHTCTFLIVIPCKFKLVIIRRFSYAFMLGIHILFNNFLIFCKRYRSKGAYHEVL